MGAWIEIKIVKTQNLEILSHPTMGAWIEMQRVILLDV